MALKRTLSVILLIFYLVSNAATTTTPRSDQLTTGEITTKVNTQTAKSLYNNATDGKENNFTSQDQSTTSDPNAGNETTSVPQHESNTSSVTRPVTDNGVATTIVTKPLPILQENYTTIYPENVRNTTSVTHPVTDNGAATTQVTNTITISQADNTTSQPHGVNNPTNPTPYPEHVSNTTKENTDHELSGDHAEHTEEIELFPLNMSHVKYPLVFTLVVLVTALCKLGFHHSQLLSSILPESCMLIIVGLIFGVILYFTKVSESLKFFSPHEFFLFLLPPIILEAAFSLHDRTFADNLGSVLLFALVGTVLNCFAMGLSLFGLYKAGAMEEINCSLLELLVFGALIAAVDPVAVLSVFQEVGVNDTLYFLLFGESLLNDGVSVVLYNVMQILNKMTDINVEVLFLGLAKFFIVVIFATLIGIANGLISSFITKFTNSVKVIEPLIVFGFAYLSYVLSELFGFSGILSIIACGILQVHYAFHNITSKSRLAVKFFAKVMATSCEIIIFLFLGIETVSPDHDWKTGFVLWSMFLCIFFRFIFTFALSLAINYFSTGKVRKIKFDEMFMISYGGLRGAVCFSLVALIDENEIPVKHLFVTTTLFVVFFTVFIQGGTIKWVIKKLRVSMAEQDKDMNLNEETNNHVFDHVMAGIEEIIGYTTGAHHIKLKLQHVDDNVVKPTLLRNATSSDLQNISNYYEKLVMKEHFKNLKLGGATLPRVRTSIRHLDSELALDQLGQEEDKKMANRHHENNNKDYNRQNPSFGDAHGRRNSSFGDNIHKFMANALHTARSRLNINNFRDRNMVRTQEPENRMVTNIRNKHIKNKQLQQLAQNSPNMRRHVMAKSGSVNLSFVSAPDLEDTRMHQVRVQLHNGQIHQEDPDNGDIVEDSDGEDRQVQFIF